MSQRHKIMRLSAAVVLLLRLPASASDWPCTSGNSLRNALSPEVGPSAPTLLWSSSILALQDRQAFTEGDRVYAMNADGSRVECLDLSTGVELWNVVIPSTPGSNGGWIAGVSQGRLYASRSFGEYATCPVYCFDSASGAPLWQSVQWIDARSYSGVVFASNGDPVIGTRATILRIDHLTGTSVWSWSRQAEDHHSGVAIRGQAVYSSELVGTHRGLLRRDLATGAIQYQIPPSIYSQSTSNTPMIGADGTIYLAIDGLPSLVAWTDTGAGFVLKWTAPTGETVLSELGLGPDGTVYFIAPGYHIGRLDPTTGALLNTSVALGPFFETTRFAIDAEGRVFLNAGIAVLYSFNADLSLRWSIPIYGTGPDCGPALAQGGTLLFSGSNGTLVSAWRDPLISSGFCAGDGSGPVACPCGNSGASGHGCANSIDANGGFLQASGVSSVTADTVVLRGSGMPDSTALYFQGTGQTAGGQGTVFGDGLRCAGGTIVRLGTAVNIDGISHYPEIGDPPLSVRGQIPAAGGTRTYQAWYRNAAPFCTSATFNLTNGASLAWTP